MILTRVLDPCRKPKVTRKVVESEGEDEETSTLYARIQEMLDGDFLEDDAEDDTPPPPGGDETNNDQSRVRGKPEKYGNLIIKKTI